MIATTTNYNNAINASKRIIKAKAELFSDSALVATYTQNDAIKSIKIDRVGEDSKFFGVGIPHKANIKLIDVNREINLTTSNYFKIQSGIQLQDGSIEYVAFPKMFVTEVNRDENTNELSITAYDVLNEAKRLIVDDLELAKPYTIRNVIEAVGAKIGANNTIIKETNLLNLKKLEEKKSTVSITDLKINSIKIESIDTTTYANVAFALNLDVGDYTLSGISLWEDSDYTGAYGAMLGISVFEKETNKRISWTDITWNETENGTRKSKAFKIENNDLYEYRLNFYVVSDVGVINRAVDFSNIMINKGEELEAYELPLTGVDLEYTDGANFEGSEKLQEALMAAAEATQTIYYINSNDDLVFKRLDRDGEPIKTISKSDYITLDSSTNKRLQTICSATELGDNVSASISEIGSTQYVRNNPFWELREDIADLLEDAKNAICGITINQFNCSWRGDLSLEIGDKIGLVTKDNNIVTSYLLSDSIEYNGGLSQTSEWQYTDEEESESNPNTLGEVIKQTTAKVDKANKTIELKTSQIDSNSEQISALKMSTDSINASVQNDINELTNKVNATMTAEDVKLEIQSEIANGVDKVTTKTGFTFNDEGLHMAKTGEEMSSSYTNDGILIKRDEDERLKVNNEGVFAYNLHAKTYLIVGESSRFEDYEKDGETRTGCFWIGGN